MLGFCYLYAYGTQAAHRRTGRMTDRETVGSLTPQDAMRPERPLPNRTLRRIRSERQDNPFDKEQRIGRMHRYLQRKRVAPGRAPAPRNGKTDNSLNDTVSELTNDTSRSSTLFHPHGFTATALLSGRPEHPADNSMQHKAITAQYRTVRISGSNY